MSSAPSPPHVVEDCLGILQVLSDGSILRSPNPVVPVPVRDDGTVVWKDVQFDAAYDLHLRLYKPRNRLPSDGLKLPVFYYFHGGGFCFGSCTLSAYQNCCLRLAAELRAVVVAPDYRLAPEHRLPAAIDDGASAVEWLRRQAVSPDQDPWLAEAADFGRVFISGESAGGNIAHHMAVRFGSAAGRAELHPVQICGFVLMMPFIGGIQRTRSEAQCPKELFLNLEANDRYWRLSLPAGGTRDHPLANPFGPESPSLEAVEVEPVLVVVAENDLLRDRGVDYAKRLEGWGKRVKLVEFKGQQHAFFYFGAWSEPVDELMTVIKRFMDEVGTGLG
ncbi:probable carboxylesterase 15 [Phoenix dactylifera]|uniref:Probable carboxylesterase 15 n=1 Tax=Phoenix dactylifera TaxID=42345 RepID=A0A8B7BK56_PHODC|nr:probable carboxylesterase 15 [Phoenix dactylifera]